MASLEFIRYMPHRYESNATVAGTSPSGRVIEQLPQLVWKNNSTWGEANLWAMEQAHSKDIKTVHAAMAHLLGYANWLESEDVGWWHFPARKSDRCLLRYRGALIRSRDRGEIAPSTASVRMSTVIRFYRWLQASGLLSTSWPMWAEVQVGIRLIDKFGFGHTLRVASTDLSIRNTKVAGAIELEDGVMPLTTEGMREITQFANTKASEELALMLQVGFGTGLRLGSILNLKVATLQQSSVDPVAGWYRIHVGPGARPPVATKYGKSGLVPIPTPLLERLKEYAGSTRRLKRQALAAPEERDLLFLTRFGKSYSGLKSRAINVEMSRFRAAGRTGGLEAFRQFHFHRTRATFATMLMQATLRYMPVGDAVQFVREACLHKNESVTLKYVKFLESSKAMAEAADAFTEAFMGLAKGSDNA